MGFGSMMWKRINRDFVYKAKTTDEVSFVVDTILLPDGQEREYCFVDCPYHVVAIVAIDQDLKVAAIRQHRYVVDEILIEVPCGSPNESETLAEGAARELAEETGVVADSLREIGTFYPSTGITNQRVTVFLATGLTAYDQDLDEMEDIEVEWIPLNDLIDMIQRGSVPSQTSAMAVLLAALHLR